MRTVALLLLLSGAGATANAPTLPDVPASRNAPGWSRQGRSLLLYGPDGALSDEIGLTREETPTVTKEVQGGISPDGQAAWTLERQLLWSKGRTRLLESRRRLRVFGRSMTALWTDDAADWPDNGDPIVFSDDSKTCLVARRLGEAWSVEARDWAGGVILKAGPFPRVHSIGLAPAGRFATARWSVPDKSDTHSFLDLKAKLRKDVETSELTLGLARLGDDGVARSGRREVLHFELSPSSPTAGAR